MMLRPLFLTAIALSLPANAAAAAQETHPPPEGLFKQVVPEPTGRNGYEELVQAGEVLRSSKLFEEVEKGEDATLARKRRVLADRPVQRAQALLKQGLSKRVLSPRPPDSLSYTTLLPELSTFRSLARLLAIQQYVFLADGRTGDAVETARLCLILGQAIQTDTLVSGLVGIAVSAVAIRSLGAHLDQLSARDCERLYAICLEWHQAPDPSVPILAMERRLTPRFLQDVVGRTKKDGLRGFAEITGVSGMELGAAREHLASLTDGDLDILARETAKRADQHYERLFAELRKPLWQRSAEALDYESDGSTASWLARQILPTGMAASNAYGRLQALMRLLACHCTIRRYRWEHERLPQSLAALNLGELARDPFSGNLLTYEVQGRSYTLSSIGAPTSVDNPRAVNGRLPLSVGPTE